MARENSRDALEAGLQARADELEIDVRTTKDGVAVLWHDKTVADLKISDTSFASLRKADPRLLTLEQAIRLVDRRVPLAIEVKRGTNPVIICSVLRSFLHQKWKAFDFRLASFSQPLLRELHRQLPDMPTIVIEPWSSVRATHRARQLGTRFICMNQRFLWSGFIAAMRRRGYNLSAYTVNDPGKARRWARHGLYAVVTDFPDRFKHGDS